MTRKTKTLITVAAAAWSLYPVLGCEKTKEMRRTPTMYFQSFAQTQIFQILNKSFSQLLSLKYFKY